MELRDFLPIGVGRVYTLPSKFRFHQTSDKDGMIYSVCRYRNKEKVDASSLDSFTLAERVVQALVVAHSFVLKGITGLVSFSSLSRGDPLTERLDNGATVMP